MSHNAFGNLNKFRVGDWERYLRVVHICIKLFFLQVSQPDPSAPVGAALLQLDMRETYVYKRDKIHIVILEPIHRIGNLSSCDFMKLVCSSPCRQHSKF